MSRIAAMLTILGLLVGCADLNERIAKVTHDKSPNTFSSTGGPVIGLILATPPVNTLVFDPCLREEVAMDDYKRSLCNLKHQIKGTTPPWERTAAEARLMSYQPGELQCARTLGGVTDCRVISGMPRPVTLVSPNMGSN